MKSTHISDIQTYQTQISQAKHRLHLIKIHIQQQRKKRQLLDQLSSPQQYSHQAQQQQIDSYATQSNEDSKSIENSQSSVASSMVIKKQFAQIQQYMKQYYQQNQHLELDENKEEDIGRKLVRTYALQQERRRQKDRKQLGIQKNRKEIKYLNTDGRSKPNNEIDPNNTRMDKQKMKQSQNLTQTRKRTYRIFDNTKSIFEVVEQEGEKMRQKIRIELGEEYLKNGIRNEVEQRIQKRLEEVLNKRKQNIATDDKQESERSQIDWVGKQIEIVGSWEKRHSFCRQIVRKGSDYYGKLLKQVQKQETKCRKLQYKLRNLETSTFAKYH